MGVVSGAIWRAAQRARLVLTHEPFACLHRDTGIGRVRIHACGFQRPTWLRWGDGPGQYIRARGPHPGWSGLPAARGSLIARDCWVRGQKQRSSARCWAPVGGLHGSPELARSLVFLLPASCWEALVPLPDGMLRLPADTAGLFFLRAIARRSPFSNAGDTCKEEIALTKACSSCLSMMLRQAHYKGYFAPIPQLGNRCKTSAESSEVGNLFI